MPLRLRRRSKSQSVAQLRVPFRNVREVSGTSVLHPDWLPPSERMADIAVVLHLDDVKRLDPYLAAMASAGVRLDLFIMLPEGSATVAPSPSIGGGFVEVLQADSVGDHLFQLSALVNSERLVGYRTVVRHVDDGPASVERFGRLDLRSVDGLVHGDLSRAGVFIPGGKQGLSVGRDVSYRISQLLKRVNSRIRQPGVVPGDRSLSTIAVRGAVLEFLRPLRLDHQDFHIDYAKYIHEGQASEYIQPAEADRFAARAIECVFYGFLDTAGLRLEDVSSVAAASGVTVPAGTARARAWAVYHPDLTTPSRTRNATWSQLAGAMPMFLGQQLPIGAGMIGFADPERPADRARQVELARSVGVSGFLVLTNWGEDGFDNEPFFESLRDDEDFPWALVLQHSVVRRINPLGATPRLSPWVDEGPQSYPRQAARIAQLTAGASYLRIDERPVVIIQDLASMARPMEFIASIREAVQAASGISPWLAIVETSLATSRPGGPVVPEGLDGVIQMPPENGIMRQRLKLGGRFGGFTGVALNLAPASTVTTISVEARHNDSIFPGALVGFDSTPEMRSQGTVGYNWNIADFRKMLDRAVRSVAWRDEERRIVIINSWNGWSDMSQLEPGYHRGQSYLSTVRDVLFL